MQLSVEQLAVEQLPQQQRQRCEVWTRVMGYFRPVDSFNKGKVGEHRQRRHFTEDAAMVEDLFGHAG